MPEPTAAEPWTVTLAWTPDQNSSRVSVLHTRTPVFAVIGLIRAGELFDDIADDYGLTREQVEVLSHLAEEAQEWT